MPSEYLAFDVLAQLLTGPLSGRSGVLLDIGYDVDERAAALADAAACFNSDQLAALEWTIILINSFNRISIASHHQPRLDD